MKQLNFCAIKVVYSYGMSPIPGVSFVYAISCTFPNSGLAGEHCLINADLHGRGIDNRFVFVMNMV